MGRGVADGVVEVSLTLLKSRRELLACAVLSMVERLLVKEGTSSTDARCSWPGSPVAQELIVRLSAIEEAEVPSREVSNEVCRWPKSGDENVDV